MPRSNFNRPVKSGKSQCGSSGTNVVDFKRRKMKVGKKISKGNETKIKVSFGKINMPVQTIRSRFDGENGNTNTDEDYVDPEEAKYYQDKYLQELGKEEINNTVIGNQVIQDRTSGISEELNDKEEA